MQWLLTVSPSLPETHWVASYLARTRDGPAIDLPRYGLLREPEYYFVVPYPVRDGKLFSLLSPVDGFRLT